MKKRILSIMLTLCMIMAFMPQMAFAETSDFNFTISGNKVTITKYTGSDTVVEIPSKLGGDFPVTSIGDDAFKDCRSLTSVTIPNSVESIGYRAFQNCSSLASITIPNSVTSIGSRAFYNCSGLTSITIPNSVKSIGDYSFEGCSNLTSIEIPNSVTSIGSNAFDPYNLNSIFLPYGLDVSSANIRREATQVRYSLDVEGEVTITGITLGIGKSSVDIPSTISGNPVTAIGKEAFNSCTGLTSVTIPSSVTTIGLGAFRSCSSITSIEIPDSVTAIGDNAFYQCTGLTSVTIPSSVTSIGLGVFSGCTGLRSIEIPNSVSTVGKYAFSDCTGLTSVTIPSSVTTIGLGAFENCSSITSIEIPNSVSTVGEYAFSGCTNLATIFFPAKFNSSSWGVSNSKIVKYKVDDSGNNVEITYIYVPSGKSNVDMPAKICGYPVVAVVANEQEKVGEHTHVGGTATCQSKATCGICGQKYGELRGHTYNWQSQDGKYWGECKICNDETGKKDIPTITINGADSVCVTQDYEFSFTLPENVTNATYGYEFENKGEGLLDPTIENGKMVAVISADIYETNEDSFKIIIDAKTEDGFEFSVSKTVALNKEHSIAKLPPEIINGKGQSIVAGEKKELTFRSNADFSDFIRVEIDGKTLDAKYYTAKEGSTIITLKADYVASLSAGEHIIGIVSTSGTATAKFTVEAGTAPKTGDERNLILWLALLFVSGGMMTVTGIYYKKKKYNR